MPTTCIVLVMLQPPVAAIVNLKGGSMQGVSEWMPVRASSWVSGTDRLLPLEASLSSLGFATFPLIDPSLDV